MTIPQLPVVIKREIPTARLPVNYEAAKTALAQCVQIDECKEWADKAAAIASYAKQIKDDQLKESAARIKVRAQIRIGELLSEIAPAKAGLGRKGKFSPGTMKNPNSRVGVARQAGISDNAAFAYIAMARVPKEKREQLIEASPPVQPSELSTIGRQIWHSCNRFKATDAYLAVMSANWRGLGQLAQWTEKNAAADLASQMSSDEAGMIRPHLRKLEEWIDDLDRRLPRTEPTR